MSKSNEFTDTWDLEKKKTMLQKGIQFNLNVFIKLTVTPHHSQRIPARHSDDQQVFLQATHLEFGGRLPSRQWW